MSSVEDRVHAAMSAAGDLADREITSAPPLRLPSGRRPVARRGRPRRRWVLWAAPVTAAAAVVTLAVTLVVVRGAGGDSTLPVPPAPSASAAAPAGPGGAPRYYAAQSMTSDGIVIGDSVTGKILATVNPPAHKNLTTWFQHLTAAADDQTFAFSAATVPTASLKAVNGALTAKATVTWYEVRLTPGAAHPARLIAVPIKPQTMTSATAQGYVTNALSRSGQELAVTGLTPANGLAVRVYAVASGRLLHEWTTNASSLTAANSFTKGLATRPALTWIDGDRTLALEYGTNGPATPRLGFGLTDTVRELPVAGPSRGDLVADGKVAWNERTGEYPGTLLEACTGGIAGQHFLSADGTTFGCAAVTGKGSDPDLSFVTYPLGAGAATAGQATVHYQVLHMAQVPVSSQTFLWVSPSGDAVIGAWAAQQKGTVTDDPDGLHVGVMSHGKYTPLKFPPGFDRAANIASITW